MRCYQHTLATYPLTSHVQRSNVNIHGIAPYRVYLISLQHDLYILSVALFLTFRRMAVNHYNCTMVSGLSSKFSRMRESQKKEKPNQIEFLAIRRFTKTKVQLSKNNYQINFKFHSITFNFSTLK